MNVPDWMKRRRDCRALWRPVHRTDQQMHLERNPARWQCVNDVVMGGLSVSRVEEAAPGIRFSGEISLRNNGGFASVRCPFQPDVFDSAGFCLHLRGDGRRYHFRLRASDAAGEPAWRAEFDTTGHDQVIALRWADFVPVIRGRRLADHAPLDPAAMRSLGFMVADRRAGPFALHVTAIENLYFRKATDE